MSFSYEAVPFDFGFDFRLTSEADLIAVCLRNYAPAYQLDVPPPAVAPTFGSVNIYGMPYIC